MATAPIFRPGLSPEQIADATLNEAREDHGVDDAVAALYANPHEDQENGDQAENENEPAGGEDEAAQPRAPPVPGVVLDATLPQGEQLQVTYSVAPTTAVEAYFMRHAIFLHALSRPDAEVPAGTKEAIREEMSSVHAARTINRIFSDLKDEVQSRTHFTIQGMALTDDPIGEVVPVPEVRTRNRGIDLDYKTLRNATLQCGNIKLSGSAAIDPIAFRDVLQRLAKFISNSRLHQDGALCLLEHFTDGLLRSTVQGCMSSGSGFTSAWMAINKELNRSQSPTELTRELETLKSKKPYYLAQTVHRLHHLRRALGGSEKTILSGVRSDIFFLLHSFYRPYYQHIAHRDADRAAILKAAMESATRNNTTVPADLKARSHPFMGLVDILSSTLKEWRIATPPKTSGNGLFNPGQQKPNNFSRQLGGSYTQVGAMHEQDPRVRPPGHQLHNAARGDDWQHNWNFALNHARPNRVIVSEASYEGAGSAHPGQYYHQENAAIGSPNSAPTQGPSSGMLQGSYLNPIMGSGQRTQPKKQTGATSKAPPPWAGHKGCRLCGDLGSGGQPPHFARDCPMYKDDSRMGNVKCGDCGGFHYALCRQQKHQVALLGASYPQQSAEASAAHFDHQNPNHGFRDVAESVAPDYPSSEDES